MSKRALAFVSLAMMAVACDEPQPASDAAMIDAGSANDAGLIDADLVDAGDDSGRSDAGPSCSDCTDDEVCLRGVCIAFCGEDLSGLDDALSPDLIPLAHFCRSPSALTVVPSESGDPRVYDLVHASESGASVFTVSSWTASPGAPLTPIEVASHRVEAAPEWGEATPYPSAFLSVDANESALLFGYTVFVTDTILGEVLHVDIGSGDVRGFEAPGNFDAAWLDETRFVVNGFGLGAEHHEQGVYAMDVETGTATWVATGLGAYSGSVALTADYALVGGTAEDLAPLAFVVPRAVFESAAGGGGAIDMMTSGVAVTTPDGAPLASSFTTLDGDRIAVAQYDGPIQVWSTSYAGGQLTLSAEPDLSSDTFISAHDAGGGRILLQHTGGLLLVRPGE